jgi:hypothetical protein
VRENRTTPAVIQEDRGSLLYSVIGRSEKPLVRTLEKTQEMIFLVICFHLSTTTVFLPFSAVQDVPAFSVQLILLVLFCKRAGNALQPNKFQSASI